MVSTDELERYAERIIRMLAEMSEAIARIGEAIIERFRDMAERLANKGTKAIKRPFTATRYRRPGNGRQGGLEERKRQA